MTLVLLFLSLFLVLVHPQILAIDYGTQYIKAALVQTGAGKTFSIVENHKSQRKFINSLGLYNSQRFYEAQTIAKRSRGPQNCFIYSRLLVDLHRNPSKLQMVRKDLFLEYVKDAEVDQMMVEFVLNGYPQGEDKITLLEGIGMMIKYVKLAAQKTTNGPIKDVVLVVPNHWNIHQRKFLIQAAQLADLYVLSLIHQNTAAAINYALSHRSTNSTQTILFYNVGANSLQMTLAQFKLVNNQKTKPIQSIFILGDYGETYVGGLKLDALIAGHFAKKFQQKHKKQLNQRGLIRLLAQSQKIKYVLSANKQAKIFVQGIMQGIDFNALITRKQLQQMATDTFKALTDPVKRFLFDNDLRPDDLTAIELIGGGSRIPKIQSMLGEIVDNSSLIGSHINGDQAMVLGAAFFGANSSKKFKVKGINLYDGFNFQMRLVLRNSDQTIQQDDQRYYFKNVTLFKRKSRFGASRQVNFKVKQNIIAQIYKQDQDGLQLVVSHKIDSIQDINQTSFKVSLNYEINAVEVVKLSSVKYFYEKEVSQSYTEKVRKVVPIKKGEKKDQKDEEETKQDEEKVEEQEKKDEEQDKKDEQPQKQSEEQQQKVKDDEQSEIVSEDKDNSTKKDSYGTNSAKKKKKTQKIQYQTVERFRNVTKKYDYDLKYEQSFRVFSQADQKLVNKARKLMARYQRKQEEKRDLSESKNKLQALIYELKDKLQNQQFLMYTQKNQKAKIAQLVEQKAKWYEDTYSDKAQQYKKQYKQLSQPVEKIKKRAHQHRTREEVHSRALEIIEEYQNLTKKIQKGKDWITDEQVAELNLNLTASRTRINQLYKKIQGQALNQDAVYRNKDMIKEADIAKEQYFVLKGKVKPKEEKKKVEDESKQEKEQEQATVEEKGEEEKSGEEQVDQDEL